MTLLRSLDDTRKRLGFDDKPHLNDAIQSEMEAAVEIISDRIRTHIDRRDVVDTFFVASSMTFPGIPSQRSRGRRRTGLGSGLAPSIARLKLSQGFAASASTFTIWAAETEAKLGAEATRADLQDISGTDYVSVDWDKGTVQINDYSLQNAYIRVTYTAGFLTDTGSPAVFADTPTWLVQAADLETKILVNSNPLFGRDRTNERGGDKEQDRLEKRLDLMIRSHARYFPLTHWKPTYSTSATSAD